MAKLSLTQAKAVIATYVDSSKIANETYSATVANTIGLLNQIGKIMTIQSNFVDKLGMFDGDDLPFGKTIEEWAADLILPEDYDSTGAGALSPHSSTYRPVEFSYTLGRKKIPQTIYNNDLERCVNNIEQFNACVLSKSKAMYDSETVLKYGIKRQALGVLIAKCAAEMDYSTATAVGSVTASTAVNTIVKNSTTNIGILVKPVATADVPLSWSDATSKGYVIEFKDLVKGIAKPVDTETGEAFVTELKKDVEIASDQSEGHSLNGNTLGATSAEGLVLLVRQGIQPVIDTQVLAGAFHMDKLAVPCEIVALPDFGNANDDYFAVLCDKRIMRLHNTYRAVRDNQNGDGDFINYFFHTENTVHVSRNCFVKVYKNA